MKGSWSRHVAIAWFILLALAAIAGPFTFGSRALIMNPTQLLEAPSAGHWLGTDSLGRDLFARLVAGAAVSLGVGALAVLLAVVTGTFVGAAAGYFGGAKDRALMGLVDVLLCFPSFLLILAVIAIVGPGLWNIVLVIGLTGWMGTARLVRAEVLSLKEREFVLAARALGAGSGRILTRHLIPNALSPVIINAVLGLSSAILLESGLSFLGIGVQPPTPSWGNILTDGKATLGVAWWLTLYPGLLIFLTTLAANVIGESLRENTRN